MQISEQKCPASRRHLIVARAWAWSVLAALLLVAFGCRTVPRNNVSDILLPSNYRDWSPEFSVLPTAEFIGDRVILRNVRNATYLTETDFVLEFETREYELSKLKHVDFFVVPFKGFDFIAHTMISFGFEGDEYVAVSAEIRTERGETYSPASGLARQFELTYVVADERDVVRLRTHHRDADVYLYRTVASPEQSQQLFRDVMGRINELSERPEFYNTITNNCTTNIVSHVNRIAPNKVPYSVGVLLPGYSDREAYQLGLLDRSVPFEQLKASARINDLSHAFYNDPQFSAKIRRRINEPATPRLYPLAPESMRYEGNRDTVPSEAIPSDNVPTEVLPSDLRRSARFERVRRDDSVRRASVEFPLESGAARLEPIPLEVRSETESSLNPRLLGRAPSASPPQSRTPSSNGSIFGLIPSRRDR